MPPKKKKTEETKRIEPPEPDPNVLCYLEAVSRAFPLVERVLDKHAFAFEVASATATAKGKGLELNLATQVRDFVQERDKLEEETFDLGRQIQIVEKLIAANDVQFREFYSNREKEALTEHMELTTEISRRKADAKEAKTWCEVKRSRKLELHQCNEKITRMEDAQKAEMDAVRRNHEDGNRKMRDLLVRKLKLARDTLSNATDEDPSGPSSDSLLEPGTSVAPTAKLNEKLSREVAMYEREAKIVSDNNRKLEEEGRVAEHQLAEERQANEKIFARNAGQSKTLQMIQGRRTEAADHQRSNIKIQVMGAAERKAALQSTVVDQQGIIDDLQGEVLIVQRELSLYHQRKDSLDLQFQQYQNKRDKSMELLQFMLTNDVVPKTETMPSDTGVVTKFVEPLAPLGLFTKESVLRFMMGVVQQDLR